MEEKTSSVVPRDQQQARLVERLQAAAGDPVDFEELRAIGIEHPAVLSYELEVAGVPIVQARDANRRTLALERPAQRADGAQQECEQTDALRPSPSARAGEAALRVRSLRQRAAVGAGAIRGWLRPRAIRARQSAAGLPARARLTVLRGRAAVGRAERKRRTISSGRTARAALLAGVLALSLAATAALVVALINLGDTPRSSLPTQTRRPDAPRQSAAGPNGAGRTASSPGQPPPVAQASGGVQAPTAPVRVSLAAATALEAEGHQLLAAGSYRAAVDHLLGAIRASGQSLQRCAEPTTDACLTFAYALYDLGRTLRLKGEPGAAIPVLSQRLRIDNQRAVVQHELALARGSGA